MSSFSASKCDCKQAQLEHVGLAPEVMDSTCDVQPFFLDLVSWIQTESWVKNCCSPAVQGKGAVKPIRKYGE